LTKGLEIYLVFVCGQYYQWRHFRKYGIWL
jgi:hypothetical protein